MSNVSDWTKGKEKLIEVYAKAGSGDHIVKSCILNEALYIRFLNRREKGVRPSDRAYCTWKRKILTSNLGDNYKCSALLPVG